jgi:hypothetical protein
MQEPVQRLNLAFAITHPCIIVQMCVAREA